MAEGNSDDMGSDSTESEQAATEATKFMHRVLAMADAEPTVDQGGARPGAMVIGLLNAAAVIMATEWTGTASALKEAWRDATRGFAHEMLLYTWSQRDDVMPGSAGGPSGRKPIEH